MTVTMVRQWKKDTYCHKPKNDSGQDCLNWANSFEECIKN